MTDVTHDYDVAVLGSHLTPALLAAVLAKQGLRVVMVGGADDPDAASGASTVPFTSAVLDLLADRFQAPEIAAFGHFPDLPDAVREVSGIKKSLTFLHHSTGQHHDPARTVQFNVPSEHDEWHPHRPTADEHARAVALTYGAAEVSPPASVSSVELSDDGAVVAFADGRRFGARFVVDAMGSRSPLVERLGDAARQGGLRLRSRLLATYMRDVRPFEEGARKAEYGPMSPSAAGTVHHVFEGGWIQVAAFGNHHAASTDPHDRAGQRAGQKCSVVVGLDPERFTDLPIDPGKAFTALIERFPSVAAQFAQAEPVRPWTHERVWQRRACDTYGPCWFRMDRSASRTDEFLARDTTMGAEMVHALGSALPRILSDRTSAERELARVAQFQQDLIDFNDRMLSGARVACADFHLWNAYSRVWLLWQILATLSLYRALADCHATEPASWAPVECFDQGALWFAFPEGLRELLDWFFAELDQVSSGSRTPKAAADAIFRRLRRERFVPPLYRFGDPAARFYYFTRLRRLLMLAWVKTIAPADFKRLLARENRTGQRA